MMSTFRIIPTLDADFGTHKIDEEPDKYRQTAVNILSLTLTRPLRRRLRMRWFFDVSKVKESSFFIGLRCPLSDF